MADNVRHRSDELLTELMVKNKTIIGFLHAIFNFLANRTDFYHVAQQNGDGMGFPPGFAEELVMKILKKCNPDIKNENNRGFPDGNPQNMNYNRFLPTLVAEEVEISTNDDDYIDNDLSLDEFTVDVENDCIKNEEIISSDEKISATDMSVVSNKFHNQDTSPDLNIQSLNIQCNSISQDIADSDSLQKDSSFNICTETNSLPASPVQLHSPSVKQTCVVTEESKYRDSDAYNGAITDDYSWSQTICELDVTIKLPDEIKSSKQLKINITSDAISVQYSIGKDWIILIEDTFSYSIKQGETVWLMSEGYIRIHIEKQKEKWWHALVKSEPAIDTSKLDCSRPLHELPEDHIDKVRELQYNQMMKMAGKPTSDDARQRELLKKAWHEPGSPFADTKFDPNIPILK